MKRLFAAIKITPDEIFLRIYYHLLNQLKDESIKWVKPQNIHLTLKFFGEIEEQRIDKICKVFDAIASDYNPKKYRLKGVGIFGSSYKPRVIWVGIDDNKMLKVLGNDVLKRLNDVGFPADRQNFVPHLTIGRIKELRHKNWFQTTINQLKEEFIQDITVDEICLFESILKPKGPVYEVIENFKLT